MCKYMNNMYAHIYTGGMFVAVACIVLQALQCVAACCIVFQCVAVCCSVLQCPIPSSEVYTEDSNGKNGGEFRGGSRCDAFSASSGLYLYFFSKNMVTFKLTHMFCFS